MGPSPASHGGGGTGPTECSSGISCRGRIVGDQLVAAGVERVQGQAAVPQVEELPTQVRHDVPVLPGEQTGVHRDLVLGAAHRVSRAHSGNARCAGSTNPSGSPAAKDAAWL